MVFPVSRFIRQQISLLLFKGKWRKRNSHNLTTVNRVFPLDLVDVGKMTYGLIDINYFNNSEEHLKIGNYVSIAGNVLFILGGNHHITGLTTYPLYSKYLKNDPSRDATTKGSIIVEDEVWIGSNVTILSGITIGKGAVIAAGAVVVSDIPPYSIAGGNPAKVLKYRFDQDIIEKIKCISLNSLPEEFIKKNIDKFYEPLDTGSEFFREILEFSDNKPGNE